MSNILQKVNEIVAVLMMKKISVSLQCILSVMCAKVIPNKPNKNSNIIACSCCSYPTLESLQLSR